MLSRLVIAVVVCDMWLMWYKDSRGGGVSEIWERSQKDRKEKSENEKVWKVPSCAGPRSKRSAYTGNEKRVRKEKRVGG
jgi:hypothetical protein